MAARPEFTLENLRFVSKASPSSITIPAKAGLSTRIIELWVDGPADKSYVDIIVGTRVVARLPLKWGDSLFVAPYTGSVENKSIFSLIRKIFGDNVYVEADESEDITFEFSSPPSYAHVLYARFTGEVDKSLPLRSLQAWVPHFHILTHSASVNATKNYSLDSALVPTGFPAVKDGDTIPAGVELELRALAFGSAASGNTRPTALHVWKGTFEMFTPEGHEGVSVRPGANVLVADVKTMDVFEVPPYTFTAGEKLTATFDAEYDGTNAIAAGTLAAFLIGVLRKVR